MRARASLLLTLCLFLFALAGCPPEPSGKTPAKTPAAGGGGGGGGGGGNPAGGGGDDPLSWTVIDAEAFAAMAEDDCAWPMLEPMGTVPSPTSLRAPADVPAEQRPSASKVQVLEQLVRSVVAEHLQPDDLQGALGVDEEGRAYVKLGADGRAGTATIDSHPETDTPVFTLVVNQEGRTSVEALRKRVAEVVHEDLAQTLAEERHRLEAHPNVPYAGNASLRDDPHGFGVQFPWLFAFVSEDKVSVILVEVPHMALDPDAAPTPGEDPNQGGD